MPKAPPSLRQPRRLHRRWDHRREQQHPNHRDHRRPGAGSSAIDLEEATINYVGSGGQAYLVLDDEDITVDGADGTVLERGSDRATLSINLEEAAGPLEADDDASVTIMTGQGVQTTATITVPSTLESEARVCVSDAWRVAN